MYVVMAQERIEVLGIWVIVENWHPVAERDTWSAAQDYIKANPKLWVEYKVIERCESY